jgi:hypothetical protein
MSKVRKIILVSGCMNIDKSREFVPFQIRICEGTWRPRRCGHSGQMGCLALGSLHIKLRNEILHLTPPFKIFADLTALARNP